MNQQALTKYKANAFDLKGIIQRKRLDLVGSLLYWKAQFVDQDHAGNTIQLLHTNPQKKIMSLETKKGMSTFHNCWVLANHLRENYCNAAQEERKKKRHHMQTSLLLPRDVKAPISLLHDLWTITQSPLTPKHHRKLLVFRLKQQYHTRTFGDHYAIVSQEQKSKTVVMMVIILLQIGE